MSRTQIQAKRLSELYNLDPALIDFVDVDLSDDISLYVDPLLFWKSPHIEHHAVHAKIISFFESARQLVLNGQERLAKNRFVFPEPENLLGVSRKGHKGRGLHEDLGGRVFEGIVRNKDILQNGLHFLNELQLVIDKLGPDSISDMTVNIVKEYFIDYTQRQCKKHKIPMREAAVVLLDSNTWEVDERIVELPFHPETGEPFILTPRIVVRRDEISLNYKEVYHDYLRQIFKNRLQSQYTGLAKPPRLTWAEVEKHYPKTKEVVTKELSSNPEARLEVAESVSRDIQKHARNISFEALGKTPESHLISVEVLKSVALSITDDKKLKEDIESTINEKPGAIGILLDDVNDIIRRTSAELTLLLGSYSKDQADPFEPVRNFLKDDEYETCVIKDMPDINHVNPRHKLLSYAVLSRFVVVLDFGPSGHLNEIEILKDLGKPVILISADEKGASYMTAGIDFGNNFFKRFSYEKYGTLENCLDEGIRWANNLIQELERHNREKLPWLPGYKT